MCIRDRFSTARRNSSTQGWTQKKMGSCKQSLLRNYPQKKSRYYWLKKKERRLTMGSNVLPEPNRFNRSCERKREPVPKHQEKPIMGLQTNKNFIVSNAVENILAPAKVQKEDVRYVEKKDFGKVPQYLNTIKSNIQNEYDMIQNMHISEANEMEKQRYSLPPEEIQALRDGLKKKWEVVNKVYQEITHKKKVDTIGLKRKKEGCEKELAQLEKDIERLNKQYVFVDTGY
eukprot:TRINITY_DN6595_c0_g1_i2.p1 TRINITY_DN6595_c0_g1~~TRINITY_DN6595_c0_g1_i2.p1  ORF type:complete len:263 (+),score=36.99 TRINITY_DN6595_c0_g1_i2:101-790(+)